jgi:hypothetical protein
VELLQRTVVGAMAAGAIVLSSVTMGAVDAAGKPNCLTAVPCPPPTNQRAAPADGSTERIDADRVLVAGKPICYRVPCPPPE